MALFEGRPALRARSARSSDFVRRASRPHAAAMALRHCRHFRFPSASPGPRARSVLPFCLVFYRTETGSRAKSPIDSLRPHKAISSFKPKSRFQQICALLQWQKTREVVLTEHC